MISVNLLCAPSTLEPHGKPGINYQQYGLSFWLKNTICVLSSLFLRIVGRIRCELGLTSEHSYNMVRNTLVLNKTKPGKWVFCFSDFQTAIQQKLVSTIWSFFMEAYTYTFTWTEHFHWIYLIRLIKNCSLGKLEVTSQVVIAPT